MNKYMLATDYSQMLLLVFMRKFTDYSNFHR